MPKNPNKKLTVRDVAEMIGVGEPRLYKWRSKGRGPKSYKPGRDIT